MASGSRRGLDGAAADGGPVAGSNPFSMSHSFASSSRAHGQVLLGDLGVELGDLEVDDLPDVVLREGVEDDGLVDAVDELRVEGLLDLLQDWPWPVLRRSRPRRWRSRGRALCRSRVPRFEVMMRTTFRKLTVRPTLSVSWPPSRTWRRMLKMSGWPSRSRRRARCCRGGGDLPRRLGRLPRSRRSPEGRR